MQLIRTLLLFLCSVSILPVFSQAPKVRNLTLGDTYQVYSMLTFNGDRLLGKCLSWKGDSLTFLQNGNNRIGFRLNEITQIEAWDGNPIEMSGRELFMLKSKDGKVFTGYLVSMDNFMIKFKVPRQRMIRMKPRDVESISLEPVAGDDWGKFANDYRLNGWKGEESEGKFMGFTDGLLQFQAQGDATPRQSPASSIRLLRYRKPFEPVFGHERAFMFAPTGFNLKKGHKDFRNVGYLLYNSAGYGVSDNFSIGGGNFGFIPIINAKVSYSFHPLVHVSAGVFAVTAISSGAHASISVGTPDYFLNACYLRNAETPYDSDLDFTAICYGASLRTGRRSRIFGEYILINENENEFGGFSSTWDGRKNTFTWGMGFFGERTRLEFGMMMQGPASFCFSDQNCEEIYGVLPVLSGGVKFGKKYSR